MKKMIQIGVIGSSGNNLDNETCKLAKEIGKEIARRGCILVFAQEEEVDSVSQIAARTAIKKGGQTIAFLQSNILKNNIPQAIRISTGQTRGGGREFSLILSSDAIISIGGASGTLMEIAMAYQANIPIIALQESGGWSSKLAGKFLDNRKRLKIISVKSPKEAVNAAILLSKSIPAHRE